MKTASTVQLKRFEQDQSDHGGDNQDEQRLVGCDPPLVRYSRLTWCGSPRPLRPATRATKRRSRVRHSGLTFIEVMIAPWQARSAPIPRYI
jgi:hypothetical protein